MQHTTVTYPQFLRALALARKYHHGWATALEDLGLVSDDGRPEAQWQGDPERAMHRESILAIATPDELAALARVEAAILPQDAEAAPLEVAVADLEAVSLIGSASWPEPMRNGIWAPYLDHDGDTSHETGSGRLEWTVRRDGSVSLGVCRPGAELFRVRTLLRGSRPGEWWDMEVESTTALRAMVKATFAEVRADRPMHRAEAVGLLGAKGALTHALISRDITVASRLPEDPEPAPEVQALIDQMDVLLELVPDGRESLTVLHASVGPEAESREYADGTPARTPGHGNVVRRSTVSVTRERDGGALYLRHVLALRDALGALGVEWEPRLELA